MSEDHPYDEEVGEDGYPRNEWKPRLYNEWEQNTRPTVEECMCDRTGSSVTIVTYPRSGGIEVQCDDHDRNLCDLMERSPIQCRLSIRHIDDYPFD